MGTIRNRLQIVLYRIKLRTKLTYRLFGYFLIGLGEKIINEKKDSNVTPNIPPTYMKQKHWSDTIARKAKEERIIN